MAEAWQIEGARQLRKTLKGADPLLLDRIKAAHRQAADTVKSAAEVPHLTGRLGATVRASGTKTAAVVRAGTARVPYAGPIHWGWGRRHIKAQPFLSEAAQRTEPTWFEAYHREVLAVLDTIEGATTT